MKVKAVFQPEMRWRLVEEFGPDCFEVLPDGTLLFDCEYSDEEYLLNWMLTCRNQVEVLEPANIRQRLYRIARGIVEKYDEKES